MAKTTYALIASAIRNHQRIRNGRLHRYLRDDGVTILGEALHVPGAFEEVGYGVIQLSDLTQQTSFDI